MSDIFRGIVFYMTLGPEKARISRLVTEHGGTMAQHPSSNTILLLDLDRTPTIPNTQWPMFNTKLVDQSVAQQRFLNPKDFEIKPPRLTYSSTDRASQRMPYAPEEDLILMKYFNENNGKNSINFFNEMQKNGILQRTGESLKNRYKFLKQQSDEYFAELEKKVSTAKLNAIKRMPKAVQDMVVDESNEDAASAAPVDVDNPAIATKVINTLQQRTGLPIEVIVHALLICSGNVTKAETNLVKHLAPGAWTVGEDDIILNDVKESDSGGMEDEGNDDELKKEILEELQRYRSQKEIDDRGKFLKSVPNLLL